MGRPVPVEICPVGFGRNNKESVYKISDIVQITSQESRRLAMAIRKNKQQEEFHCHAFALV